MKPYEVINQVPITEVKIQEVEKTKYIDKPVTLIERVEVPKIVERIVNVEKMVTVVDKQEVLKTVDVTTHVDRVEYLENNHEVVKIVDNPIIVKEKETQVKEVKVKWPYKVTEMKEVKIFF